MTEAELKLSTIIATKRLAGDELELAHMTVTRLAHARSKYGQLEIATDDRSYLVEALEEIADNLNYLGMEMIRVMRALKKEEK